MYAIVYENSVILTQPKWNPKMFNSVLEDECGIQTNLTLSDEIKVPIIFDFEKPVQKQTGTKEILTEVQKEKQRPVIDPETGVQKVDIENSPVFETIIVTEPVILQEPIFEAVMETKQAKVLSYTENLPPHNPKTQWLFGPNYDIQENLVVGNYEIKPLNLDIAKSYLLDKLPAARYEKENKQINVFLQGLKLAINTDRDTRAIYANKLLGMGENTINWKFNEGWLSVNKADLEYIIQQIDFAVQEAFDWELSKMNEIKVCKTLEDIDKIVI